MAMTISFGDSGSSSVANWGFILLILAIFLFFTGMWRTISDKWGAFFGSGLWTQTIGNAKATWASIPAAARAPGINTVPPAPVTSTTGPAPASTGASSYANAPWY